MPQMRPYSRSVWIPRRRASPAGAGATLLLFGALGWLAVSENSPLASDQQDSSPSHATVTRVIDGDTFTARGPDGRDLGRVRILGIDAPELGRDSRPEMCGATDAKRAAAKMLQGKRVTLAEDSHPRQAGRDTYGRLLRYVEVEHQGQTLDVSERLIRSGYSPNTSRRNSHDRHHDYEAAESEAVQENRGLWKNCW